MATRSVAVANVKEKRQFGETKTTCPQHRARAKFEEPGTTGRSAAFHPTAAKQQTGVKQMRMTVLFILLLTASPIRESSGQGTPRDSALAAFSRDLAKLQSTIDSLGAPAYALSSPSITREYPRLTLREWDGIIERLISMAATFAAKWKDDPYVVIEGFQLTMAVSPALALRFHFREPAGR
jgi:hypothetical protein